VTGLRCWNPCVFEPGAGPGEPFRLFAGFLDGGAGIAETARARFVGENSPVTLKATEKLTFFVFLLLQLSYKWTKFSAEVSNFIYECCSADCDLWLKYLWFRDGSKLNFFLEQLGFLSFYSSLFFLLISPRTVFFTGYRRYNDDRQAHGGRTSYLEYLDEGRFIGMNYGNWRANFWNMSGADDFLSEKMSDRKRPPNRARWRDSRKSLVKRDAPAPVSAAV